MFMPPLVDENTAKRAADRLVVFAHRVAPSGGRMGHAARCVFSPPVSLPRP